MLPRVVSGNLLSLILCLCLAVPVYAKSVSVRGYYRKDGTYVRPHMRSSPDGNFWNNWSTKGNVNPYTGEMGTKTSPYGGSSLSPYSSGSQYLPYNMPAYSNPNNLGSPYTVTSPTSLPYLSPLPQSNSVSTPAYGGGAYGGAATARNSQNFMASSMIAQSSPPDEVEPTAAKYLATGDYPNAIIWYTAAINRNNSEALREKLATSYCRLASVAEPTTAVQLLHTSLAIKFLPQAEEQLNNMLQGLGYDPYNSVDRMRFADFAKQQKDFSGEIVELQQAVLLDKANGPALFRLSQTYSDYGFSDEALKTYKLAGDAGVDPDRIKAGITSCEMRAGKALQIPVYFFSSIRNVR